MTEAQESGLKEFFDFFMAREIFEKKIERNLKKIWKKNSKKFEEKKSKKKFEKKNPCFGHGTNNESISCQNEHLYKSEFISPNLRLSILGPLFS